MLAARCVHKFSIPFYVLIRRNLLRFVDSNLVLCLADLRLERSWIELEQQVAFLHELPIGEIHLVI